MLEKLSGARHSRYISFAAKLAKSIPFQHRHVALIVKGGKVLAIGRNSYDTGNHAETCAMRQRWSSDLQGATLYVIRIGRVQPYLLSKPCPNCEALIKESGIKRVIYTTSDPDRPIEYESY